MLHYLYITMDCKSTISVLGLFVFGTAAQDDTAWENSKDVVNLSQDTFDQEVAKRPHFVMFYAPG